MELWLTTSIIFKYFVLIIIFSRAGTALRGGGLAPEVLMRSGEVFHGYQDNPGSTVKIPTSILLEYFIPPSTFALANHHSIRPIKARISEKFRCDYKYSTTAEGWLKYHEIPATWFDARLRCALEGGILASPTTPGLMSFLVKLLNDDENEVINKVIFTGIHATFSKGDYYSVDGVPLTEIPHKWEAYEPNNINNDEDCLTINNQGFLSDVNCNRTLPYYCFKAENSTEEMGDCGTVEPEYKYDNRTNSCYKFHTVPRTFSRAFFACSAEGGYLAIINNDTEAVVIKELFSKYPASTMIGNVSKDVAFVGFSDWGEHGDWRTIHGQTLEEAGYATFANGEPNRSPAGGEYCGSVYRNGELNDADCDGPHVFICEKAPEYPAVCSNSDDATK